MSTSGSRTRREYRNGKGKTSSAVIDARNRRDTYKYREYQKETKYYSVPTWEKRFCFEVGGLPWKRVTEAKSYNHLYGYVMEWNDSAGKKAFDDAKARFWAEINGFRSETCLPDPNMYIDEDIDWESEIDPELLSGLKAAIDEANAAAEAAVEKVIEVRLDEIVPTGWDIVESFDNRTLIGMVVGD